MKDAGPSSTSPKDGGQTSSLTPGMAALLRSGAPVSDPTRSPHNSDHAAPSQDSPASATSAPAEHSGKWLLRISLFVADLLLLTLVAWIVFKAHPLNWIQISLCILAVAMGAWLTSLALWWDWKRNSAAEIRIPKAEIRKKSE